MRIYNDTGETLVINCHEYSGKKTVRLEIPPGLDSFYESRHLPPYLRVQPATASAGAPKSGVVPKDTSSSTASGRAEE